MPELTEDILTDLRQLLASFSSVTDLVGTRIRCHELDSSDGTQDAVILELPNARQWNCLSGEAVVNGDVIVRCVSLNKVRAATIGKAIFDQLKTFSGAAGDGFITQCERSQLTSYFVPNEDGDDAGHHETEHLYSVWYQSN